LTGYGDPELLVAQWLVDELNLNVRADPDIRADSWADAPLVHVQRGQGLGSPALSLDDVVLDVDVYGAEADRVRLVAHEIWSAMILRLPLTTFDNGVFCKFASAVSAPIWAPDPSAYRRTAAYRVILHGFVTS
jgi:hypothetical protein